MAYGDIESVLGHVLKVEIAGLTPLITGFEKGLDAIIDLRHVVQKYAILAQAQAVRNVSGVTVTYSGGTFIINRQTGKLARSIQILPDPGGSPLAAMIVASAKYAAAIEGGTAQRDLKALLMGKTVPLRVQGGAKARKKSVAEGRAVMREKRASTGRSSGSEAIMFRRIGPSSKGWIVPAQAARPFMQATAEAIEPDFAREIEATFAKYIEGL